MVETLYYFKIIFSPSCCDPNCDNIYKIFFYFSNCLTSFIRYFFPLITSLITYDVTPTSLSAKASTNPSPPRGPITRTMMKKIHMGLSQDDQFNHGLLLYSHGPKKSPKYELMHGESSLDLN